MPPARTQTLVDRQAISSETLMFGVVPTRLPRLMLSILIDVGILAFALIPAWILGRIAVASSVIVVVVCMVTAIHRTGQSVGQKLCGVRVVDPTTSLPGTWRALASMKCVSVDIHLGRDPLRVQPRPLGMIPNATSWIEDSEQHQAKVFILVADDGLRWPIQGPTLIGRNASDTSGRFAMISVPDMSKTVSRNHVLLEPGPGGLKVTDLGSSNGTAILRSDQPILVRQHEPATIQPGSHLLLGTRLFEVQYE